MKQKKKAKTIPPTLRGKKRYLSFRIIPAGNFSRKDVELALWSSFLSLYGSFGCAEIRLWLSAWDPVQGIGIMRYALEGDVKARAGILFLREVCGKSVSVRILGVSGAIGKLK